MSEQPQNVEIKVRVDTSEVDNLDRVSKSASKKVSQQMNSAFNQLGPKARKAVEQASQQLEKLGFGISDEVAKGSQTGFQRMVATAQKSVEKIKKMMSGVVSKVQPAEQPTRQPRSTQQESRSTSGRKGALTSRYLAGILSVAAAFKTLTTAINNANEATETASLFATVWGQKASEVNTWIEQLSKTLGVNRAEMQNTTATFYNMAKNLDLTSTQSQQLAQDLGMLAQDMASFYNMSSADVFNDIKSVLSGSGEVFSKYGAIINETTIKEYAYAKGIAAVGAELSTAEKTMARYGLMMDKTSAAHGDLARTINSPANQARIFTNNLNQLSVALGRCFQPILVVVLPILNQLTQALTSVLNSVANFTTGLLSLLGFDMSGLLDGVSGGILDDSAVAVVDEVASSVGDIGTNAAKSAKEAAKLAKGLLGIDQINNLTSNSNSGSGSSGSGGSGISSTPSIDLDLSDGLAEQESQLEGWMKRVANAILTVTETFKNGFNKNIGYVNKSLENLKKSFSNLGTAIENFLVGAWNNGLGELVYHIGSLTSAVVGAFLDISAQVTQVVANLFNYLNPATNKYTKAFLGALNNLVKVCESFVKSIGGWFATFVNSGGQAFLNVVGDIVMIIGTTLANALANCIQWVTRFMNSWAGQLIIQTVALSLNLVAGAVKAVLVAVEKTTPLISAFMLAWGGHQTIKTTTGLVKKISENIFDLAAKLESAIVDTLKFTKAIGTTLVNGVMAAITKVKLLNTTLKSHSFSEWVSLINGNIRATISKFKDWLVSLQLTVSTVAAVIKSKLIVTLTNLKTSLLGLGGTIKNAIASFISWITSLNLSTISTTAMTVATTALNAALAILTLPITLVIVGITALIAIVVAIGNKFGWWTSITEWLSEKLGWLWNGVKSFFGWKDENKVSSAFDETSDSIEEVGITFEETTSEIETTSDRFGTIASKVNQHFASIGFDAGKLASDLSEAETMMNEKFGMMSKNAQDYLDALATGNQEVLTQMSADSETYTQEILYSYQKLSENEKNTFYETYGYIKGINDDWLNYSGLTYEQLMAKHASYSANIMKREDLTAQEKDKLIDDHLTKVELAYQEELTALKKQKKEILSNSKLSDDERQRLLEDVNKKIIAKEQEKTGKVIDEIESVTDAQEKASEVQTEVVEGAADSQVDALKDVEQALSNTKKQLAAFKSESDKVANSIPKAWSGVGSKISKEFSDAKMSITNSMNTLLTMVQKNIDKIKSSMSGMTTGISTNFTKSLDTLSNSIDTKFKKMVSSIQSFAKQMKQAMNFNFPTPYLKMPHLSVTGKWDFEKQQVPKFKVNWYSSGGIFPTKTLIGVGDANKGVGNNAEAVLPLNVLWKEMQMNFDRQNQELLRAIKSNRGSGGTIVLEMNGREVARGTFESAEELARMGALPLKWL